MGKPEKNFKCGCCDAAVFENEIMRNGAPVKIKKVVFQKRYRTNEGEWKSTSSLDINDIPKAILALSKAYEHIVLSDGNVENSGKES